MDERYMRFGDFLKKKRLDASGEITLKDLSERLDISLSFLSDIENNRRKPFDSDKLDIVAHELNLSDEDKDLLFDLAGRERKAVSPDLPEYIMYSDVGEYARIALRKSKAGDITVEDWKKFIDEQENKKKE
ncbi:MAG TPA: helix-turn-helix transcriptional regulator [Anaerovoracaceae bacterium]|nr:helix-turn-helix transcriptional regulator [Anaerovoracaceae bacterium]